MIASNETLKQSALDSLKGNWTIPIAAFVVYLLIVIPLQLIPVAGSAMGLIVGGPFALGLAIFSLRFSKNEGAIIADIFSGFNYFTQALSTYLLGALYIFLWLLCLIVPGIIAAFSYSQVFYILAEEPTLSASEVLKRSKQLMDGHKMRYFMLSLSFIGWFFLCLLTMGIGFLWLAPYYSLTMTKFYENLRGETTEHEVSIPNVLDAN
jgi:uncharacterized membrane protein